jgi:hypothetical protein
MKTQQERKEDIMCLKPSWEAIDWPELPIEDRKEMLDLALARFEYMYNHNMVSMGYDYHPERWTMFEMKIGRTLAKLYKRTGLKPWEIKADGEKNEGFFVTRRVYAYIDIAKGSQRFGGLMKPQGKGVEKKKYIRCHLFAQNPVENAGWYGPEYYKTRDAFYYSPTCLHNGEWESDEKLLMERYLASIEDQEEVVA